MAVRPTDEKGIYGYEDSRFEKAVDENFHCSICYNVLKEPRMCRNNEHIFCLACISEHLRVNAETCPECGENLSLDTLRRARLASNCLSKLRINCDYTSRGCMEVNCLEDLDAHVEICGYAPVVCSNAECGMVVNRKEKVQHETESCRYRTAKCHDCRQIQEDMETLKGSLVKLGGQAEAANKTMAKTVGELKGGLRELDGKVEAANREVKRTVAKLEGSLKELDGKVEATMKSQEHAKQDQREVKKEVEEIKNEVRNVKESISKVNKDVGKVKVMMSQVLEKLVILEQLNKPPSPADEVLNEAKGDILIAGGRALTSSSTEVYSWENNVWFEMQTTNKAHCGASSFISDDHLFVVGGAGTKSIETLDLNELLLKWVRHPAKLPYRGDDHQTVVCQQRIFHVGGYNHDARWSDQISELELSSSVAMKKLCQMPDQRTRHCAETFEDKVMVLGGEDRHGRPLDSVFEFGVGRNECKELPSLPYPLTRMATVRWRDQVVVLGGRDKDRQALDDVFMYDCKTGKSKALPSMLEKRVKCCAIITGNTIVVLGGENEKNGDLSSVECFTMGGSTWEYLPAMNKARYGAIAEVLPSTKKYVYTVSK